MDIKSSVAARGSRFLDVVLQEGTLLPLTRPFGVERTETCWRPGHKGLRGVGRVKSGSDGAGAASPSLMSSRREGFTKGLGRAALAGSAAKQSRTA